MGRQSRRSRKGGADGNRTKSAGESSLREHLAVPPTLEWLDGEDSELPGDPMRRHAWATALAEKVWGRIPWHHRVFIDGRYKKLRLVSGLLLFNQETDPACEDAQRPTFCPKCGVYFDVLDHDDVPNPDASAMFSMAHGFALAYFHCRRGHDGGPIWMDAETKHFMADALAVAWGFGRELACCLDPVTKAPRVASVMGRPHPRPLAHALMAINRCAFEGSSEDVVVSVPLCLDGVPIAGATG